MSFDSTTPVNETVWIHDPETTIPGDYGVTDRAGTVHRMSLSCLLRITADGAKDEEQALLALADALDEAGLNEWPTEGPQPRISVED